MERARRGRERGAFLFGQGSPAGGGAIPMLDGYPVPIFSLPLGDAGAGAVTLTPSISIGSETPTFTRATTAYQEDFEGKRNLCLSGEARMQGARRVYNLIPAAGTGSASLAVAAAKTITVGVGTYVFSMGAEATGTSVITFTGTATGSTGTITANATKRTAKTLTITGAGDIVATCTEIAANNLLLENVTGQSNQNPSEYVSVGVLSAPYHGAGVDGVKYFSTLNANTVASNVVTEATGAAIIAGASGVAATAPVDAGGPFGYLAEGAGTNLALWSNDLTQVATWPVVTMTTAFTSTGPDGVANSATRLTATGANATILQLYVAAASSRTNSVWARRVTGTGTIKLFQGATKTADLSASLNTNTYTLIQQNANVDVTLLGFGIEIGTSGDAIDVWGNGFQAGGFATSPIPTTTVAVTRNADVLTYPSAGNASSTSGSAYAEFTSAAPATFPASIATIPLIDTYNGTEGTILQIEGAGVGHERQLMIFDGATSRYLASAYTFPVSTPTKIASSWGGSATQGVIAGGTVGSAGFDGNLNLAAVLPIGYEYGRTLSLFGTIRNVRIYGQALSAAQLQAMTS